MWALARGQHIRGCLAIEQEPDISRVHHNSARMPHLCVIRAIIRGTATALKSVLQSCSVSLIFHTLPVLSATGRHLDAVCRKAQLADEYH